MRLSNVSEDHLSRLPEARNTKVALQSDESHQTRYTHIFWIDWVKFGLFRQVWQYNATCEVCCPSVRPCARAKPSGGPTFRPDAQSVACSGYRGIYWLFRNFFRYQYFSDWLCAKALITFLQAHFAVDGPTSSSAVSTRGLVSVKINVMSGTMTNLPEKLSGHNHQVEMTYRFPWSR